MQSQLPPWLQEACHQALQGVSGKALSRDYARLSAGYRSGKPEEAKGLSLAYLAARMPATYAAVAAALRQLPPGLAARSQSLLDLGCGPGTATWAASESLPGLTQSQGLDQDPGFLSLASSLAALAPPRLQTQFKPAEFSSGPIQAEAADIVIAAYVSNEMEATAREGFFAAAWSKAQAALVLIEPGTPPGFEALLQARQALLQAGAFLLAPCPGQGPCPLAGEPTRKWCHFSQRFERSRLAKLAKAGELGYEDEKFSYLIFSRQPEARAQARVLGYPKKTEGQVQLELCEEAGLRQLRLSRRDKQLYKAAKKIQWGDAWEDKNVRG